MPVSVWDRTWITFAHVHMTFIDMNTYAIISLIVLKNLLSVQFLHNLAVVQNEDEEFNKESDTMRPEAQWLCVKEEETRRSRTSVGRICIWTQTPVYNVSAKVIYNNNNTEVSSTHLYVWLIESAGWLDNVINHWFWFILF